MELRPYQQEAVQALFHFLQHNETGSCCVSAPVGSGKTIIAAAFIRRVLDQAPNARFLLLMHRRELIAQHVEKLLKFLPYPALLGVYCAALGERDAHKKVVVASIQSAARNVPAFGKVAYCIIDECHSIGENETSMYKKTIAKLRESNPRLRVIGLTGTPYRLTSGSIISPDGLFTDLAYEISMTDLIRDGYLVPLKSRARKCRADLTKVRVRGGDYVVEELQKAFDLPDITEAALNEVFSLCADRKSILFFCVGIEHAEHVAAAIRKRGITAEAISSKTPSLFRDQHLQAFREGRLRCLTNCEILTVGTDIPCIDCIVLLRATKSPGLLIQMLGRGLRLSPETGKKDCVVLDYSGCLLEHGAIDQIRMTRRKKPNSEETELVLEKPACKACTACGIVMPAASRECADCGYIFPERQPNHAPQAIDAPVMSADIRPQRFLVGDVVYGRHEKPDKPPSMRVEYDVGNLRRWPVREWICFEHKGFARFRACQWWVERGGSLPVPETVAEALARTRELWEVGAIEVVKEGKFERVLKAEKKEEEQFDALEELGVNI